VILADKIAIQQSRAVPFLGRINYDFVAVSVDLILNGSATRPITFSAVTTSRTFQKLRVTHYSDPDDGERPGVHVVCHVSLVVEGSGHLAEFLDPVFGDQPTVGRVGARLTIWADA
jgi:hypothetical protein